jgi:hypothetical protein
LKSTNLEKVFLTRATDQEQPELSRLLIKLRSKPFWIWNEEQHKKEFEKTVGQCCFNDIIPADRPLKGSVRHPLYDYEKELQDAIESNRLVWCIKSTGLGISEWCLRYMTFLECTKGHTPEYKNSQFLIIVGPAMQLAVTIISRLRRLWEPAVYFTERESRLTINSVTFFAQPSNNLNSSRSQDKPKFFMIDEMSFFSFP